jgi:outer membrane protein OmpA-like peptidoglycan-associated protein
MKNKLFTWVMVLGLMLPVLAAVDTPAFEILTEEDFVQEVIVEEDLIKTADNAIILFDASSSMAKPYKDTGMSRYEVALKTLKERNAIMPELGWNMGLYLYTPWKEIFPMQTYNRDAFAQALGMMPEQPGHATLLMQGLHKSGKILETLSGRTVVFVYTDGTFSRFRGMKHPAEKIKELSDKYDVCFYFISTADNATNEAILAKAAKMGVCSQVVPFEAFIENPQYNSGALFMVKITEEVVTATEKKIVGIEIDDILFDFNQADIRTDFKSELDELGAFLKENPGSYAVLAGFTDYVGSEGYNLRLSAKRVKMVAAYVADIHEIDPDRLVLYWFGKEHPAASNGTEAGRSKNRRVEIAIGLQ